MQTESLSNKRDAEDEIVRAFQVAFTHSASIPPPLPMKHARTHQHQHTNTSARTHTRARACTPYLIGPFTPAKIVKGLLLR